LKIVNRKDFMQMPNGIVYSKYKSLGMIDGLYQKVKSYENDWIYQDLLASVDANDDEEFSDIMFAAEEGMEFSLDLECGERDGGFQDTDMFVLYGKADLDKLIIRLIDIQNDNVV
jgi:hypothetical protein